jgi:hypothetical protein
VIVSCIGDWMGSLYDTLGRRWDHHLFLEHDGKYERTVRREPRFERKDTGRWQYHDEGKILSSHLIEIAVLLGGAEYLLKLACPDFTVAQPTLEVRGLLHHGGLTPQFFQATAGPHQADRRRPSFNTTAKGMSAGRQVKSERLILVGMNGSSDASFLAVAVTAT